MLKLDENMLFMIINIFVLYLLLKKFLFKPVTEIMEKRTNTIAASLTEAENKNNDALKLKKEYETALQTAEEKFTEIVREAKQRALEEHEKQMIETKEEIAKMMEEANKAIELEKKKSMQDIQSEIAGIAMIAAAKVIQKNVNDGINMQIINDFLSEEGAGK